MIINKVHVDGQTFILAADQNVAALKQEIVAALGGGRSAFVDFATVGLGLISVLITPHLPIRFETIERTEEQMLEWEAYPPAVSDQQTEDLDRFLDHY
jgi:hypothetical protein